MSSNWIITHVHIVLNPELLRAIADKMEERWQEMTPGDETAIFSCPVDENTSVIIRLDQEWFAEREIKND